ncbi:MAG: hypothetical protein WAN03_06065 [Candidatus Sulfotelmatobacter sp.]
MFSSLVFWSSVSGAVFLVAGLVLIRKEMAAASGLDKVILLGYTFVAAPLAIFGTEHLLSSRAIMQLVPSWIPAPLFWTYFVGIGLFAAAASFVARKQLRWSALLLAIMFFIFVLTMDIPGVIQQPKERLSWTLMLRETAFGGGALALAGWARQENARLSKALIAIGRICVAVALIFYSIEHFIFARNAPGVPLEKMTPNWVPVPQLWAYAVGIVLLVAGAAMLFNQRTQLAATWVGTVMALITLFLYFPIYLQELRTPLALEGLNYVGDTLLFGGIALFVAIAVTPSRRQAGGTLTEFPDLPSPDVRSDVRVAQR